MLSRAPKPSFSSLIALGLVVSLYVMSYFVTVRVEHNSLGIAEAGYPAFVESVSVLFRPMEAIDRQVRAGTWAPEPIHYYGESAGRRDDIHDGRTFILDAF